MTMFPIWKTAFVMAFFVMTLAGVESSRSKRGCIKNNQDQLTKRLIATTHDNRTRPFREWAVDRDNEKYPRRVPKVPKLRFSRTIDHCDDKWVADGLNKSEGDLSQFVDRIVLLRRYGDHSILCGGVWIADKWILASAHCLLKYGIIMNISSNGYSDWVRSKHSYQTFIHNKFHSKLDRYDVGLLKVTLPNTRSISPCAPQPSDDVPDGNDACTVYRWIRKEKTIELEKTNATTFQQDGYFMYLQNKKYDHNLAKWEGPVVCKVKKSGEQKLLGIMSHAHCNTRQGKPSKIGSMGHYPAATRISQYLVWISTTIENY